jgi:hypothetical protein
MTSLTYIFIFWVYTRKPYNTFNPCTQAYTCIHIYLAWKFTDCTFFHVYHTNWHFKIPYDPSLRSYNHSHDKPHRDTPIYVSPFSWKKPIRDHFFPSITKAFQNSEIQFGQFQHYPRQQNNHSNFSSHINSIPGQQASIKGILSLTPTDYHFLTNPYMYDYHPPLYLNIIHWSFGNVQTFLYEMLDQLFIGHPTSSS